MRASVQTSPAPSVPSAAPAVVHPVIVRVTHWINAVAMIIMIMSGWEIHNAYPILPFRFPLAMTLGGWLGGATQWHFAAMWLLAANGLAYLTYGIFSGRFRRKLFPVSLRDACTEVGAALRCHLSHDDLSTYNAVQRLLYLGVIAASILVVLSGLSIWKPVQFQELTTLLGDFDNARLLHFAAMAAIVGFLAVHVAMALLVPKSLRAMVRGH